MTVFRNGKFQDERERWGLFFSSLLVAVAAQHSRFCRMGAVPPTYSVDRTVPFFVFLQPA